MFLRMSYRRFKVALSSALLVVPRSQVGHHAFHFLPQLCRYYSGLLVAMQAFFSMRRVAAGAGELLTNGDLKIRTELIFLY